MKKAMLLSLIISASITITSQNIRYAEYFIDSDPGYGKAMPIAVGLSGNDLSLTFNASITSLNHGFHYLSIRAQDNLGRWSQSSNTLFYKVPAQTAIQNITYAEYFIDTDPGYGKATAIQTNLLASDLTLGFTINTASLLNGMHLLHVRSKDAAGRWSQELQSMFFNVKLPLASNLSIRQIEYFFNTDPGVGNAKNINVPSPASDLNIDLNLDIAGLTSGNHILYLRAKDGLNQWSQVYAEGFSMLVTNTGETDIQKVFTISPNPSKGAITIKMVNDLDQIKLLIVTDLNGKIIYKNQLTSPTQQMVLTLPKGVYMIRLETTTNTFSQKLIVQ